MEMKDALQTDKICTTTIRKILDIQLLLFRTKMHSNIGSTKYIKNKPRRATQTSWLGIELVELANVAREHNVYRELLGIPSLQPSYEESGLRFCTHYK